MLRSSGCQGRSRAKARSTLGPELQSEEREENVLPRPLEIGDRVIVTDTWIAFEGGMREPERGVVIKVRVLGDADGGSYIETDLVELSDGHREWFERVRLEHLGL